MKQYVQNHRVIMTEYFDSALQSKEIIRENLSVESDQLGCEFFLEK